MRFVSYFAINALNNERGCLAEAYINDFLRHCKTRKICYEKLGFQVSFQEPFEFVPSYFESGVHSVNIIEFYYNLPEAHSYLENIRKFTREHHTSYMNKFVPSYLQSGVDSCSIIKFYYNFPEAHPYLEWEEKFYKHPCPYF